MPLKGQSLARVCFFSFFIFVQCQIEIGSNVKTNFCQKGSYVSRVEFKKTTNNLFDVAVECHSFQPQTAAILV